MRVSIFYSNFYNSLDNCCLRCYMVASIPKWALLFRCAAASRRTIHPWRRPVLCDDNSRTNPAVTLPSQLPALWRAEAKRQREDFGNDLGAHALEYAARALVAVFYAWENQALLLSDAAEETGFTSDHLRKLVRSGVIPRANLPGPIRVYRRDLPLKPGHVPTEPRRDPDQIGGLPTLKSVSNVKSAVA